MLMLKCIVLSAFLLPPLELLLMLLLSNTHVNDFEQNAAELDNVVALQFVGLFVRNYYREEDGELTIFYSPFCIDLTIKNILSLTSQLF